MSQIENAPLIETIFEIRWGEIPPNTFNFSNEEKTLLAGIISSNASHGGYTFRESIAGVPPVPYQVTHRFRREPDTWPCLQTGLGIFTVNQLGKDYDWDIFRGDIENALEIFSKSNESNIIPTINNAKIILRYQDAFYPDSSESIDSYLLNHFNLSTKLPESFFSSDDIEKNIQHVNFKFEVPLVNNHGVIAITITNAIINQTPGLLVDTIVQSNIQNISNDGFNILKVMEWLEKSHDIQRHTFTTIIKESAYKEQ